MPRNPLHPEVQPIVIAEHPAPHERTRAVGADDEVHLGSTAIFEAKPYARAAVVDADESFAEPNAIQTDGPGQDRLQVGAVDPDVRRAEALAIRRPRAMLADQAAASAVAVNQRRHLGPARRELRPQPEPLEDTGAVGRQRHRSADFAQLRGLLVDLDVEAIWPQRDRQRQSADAAADDCEATTIRCAHVAADGTP